MIQEVNDALDQANGVLKYFNVQASVEDDGAGGWYIDTDLRFERSFKPEELEKEALEKLGRWASIPESIVEEALEYAREVSGKGPYLHDVFSERYVYDANTSAYKVGFDIDVNAMAYDIASGGALVNSAEFDEFIDILLKMDREEGRYYSGLIEYFLKKEGYLKGGALFRLAHEAEYWQDERNLWYVETDDEMDPGLVTANVGWMFEPTEPEAISNIQPKNILEILQSREFSVALKFFLTDTARTPEAPIEHYTNFEVNSAMANDNAIVLTIEYSVNTTSSEQQITGLKQIIDYWDEDEDFTINQLNNFITQYVLKEIKTKGLTEVKKRFKKVFRFK